jgi:phenylacetate-coenzyme A ligase PaaK-like adenylate-forming protein
MTTADLQNKLFQIDSSEAFEALALDVFRLQAQQNTIYKNYLEAIKIAWQSIDSLKDIPFLPIEFFKTHAVKTGDFEAEVIYTSSGTSGHQTSRHHVSSNALYHETFMKGFRLFYGNPSDYVISALLPSYLERTGSSLIEMTTSLIAATGHADSGFYLHDHERLANNLNKTRQDGRKNLLLGVTFGLLDFAETFTLINPDLIVMETGGMKGRRKEMIREEVAETICSAFGVDKVHSEYGMTELMSQAYSKGDGVFSSPPWMKIMVRDTTDPLFTMPNGHGALNIIDLANVHSCSFIATQDLGKVQSDGSFEVTGRMDRADVRGCNLLIF